MPLKILNKVAKHPEGKKLIGRRTALLKQTGNLEKELEKVREKRKKAPTKKDKGKLEVQEARIKQKISNTKSEVGVVEVKILDLSVKMP